MKPEPLFSHHTNVLPAEIEPEVLRKYFTLSDRDVEQVQQCRGAVNKLGFAVQLCTLRWGGYFLRDTNEVPQSVVETLATQLGVLPLPIPGQPHNEKTRFEHLERIRRHLGFVSCDASQRERLFQTAVELSDQTPQVTALREQLYRWLYENRIVRPGPTTVEELLSAARETAFEQIYERCGGGLKPAQQQRLDELLLVPSRPEAGSGEAPPSRVSPSPLEQFKTLPRRESPEALVALTERLTHLRTLELIPSPPVQSLHPAMRHLLATWGYRYSVWSLRRFAPAKRYSVVLAFLHFVFTETVDAIIEMQDKLITRVHNQARVRRDTVVKASEQARRRAVEALEQIGGLVLDDTIPDAELRTRIFARIPNEKLAERVSECRTIRSGDDGSHLGFLTPWYSYIRQYAPALLARVPFEFGSAPALGEAVKLLQTVNERHGRKLTAAAPTGFLARRWEKYVFEPQADEPAVSRRYYEFAVLTALNEQIKSGDVTVTHSRRWTHFEDYLIPAAEWEAGRAGWYERLGLPVSAETFVRHLTEHLATVTTQVAARLSDNQAVTIDEARGEFHLTALEGSEPAPAVKALKTAIETQLPRTDLVDILIEVDQVTGFLRHFTHAAGQESRLDRVLLRRNVLAALIAVGCNLGPYRMAAASGIRVSDITRITDWYLTEPALKAACIDIVNDAARHPMSSLYGRGDTCSADGMRFYLPVNLLAADYSPRLQGRGVTLLAHTSDTYLRFFQQAIPCRLREASFVLDGLLAHDTELDPVTCFTDTHGYTEVVLATAALLGFELAPRIRDIQDQTLYKMDRQQTYPKLDCLLTGVIRPHLIRQSWDAIVRIIASLHRRIVSPSLLLNRLSSYARQNSLHQALAEIGRVYKTILILRVLDDESLRRRMGRELNKGEASHDLSRFLCFGKEGMLRGREFEDQLHTFSCLTILHNAVVAWNLRHISTLVARWRAGGQVIPDEDLRATSPLVRTHINPFGRYHFDLEKLRQTEFNPALRT